MSEHTAPYSTAAPHRITAAAEGRGGPSGLAHPAAAVIRQTERDGLDELIQAAEAEHGPVTDAEIRSLRERLARARRAQFAPGAGGTG
ncbi:MULTISPECIES: CopG family transcriptional regulator [Streptomyces]|uniref:CopG family transcriptional regulator n=1 Tax=Streptomyces TaxID=1883 RepID=UPI002F3FFD3D